MAWSPLNGSRGLIATGTVANAIDDSFETTADLEVWTFSTDRLCLCDMGASLVGGFLTRLLTPQVMAVDFAANTPRELPIKGAVKSNERFHRLAWGGLSSTPSMPYGILAGGMVDGGIGLWNPAAMMKCE